MEKETKITDEAAITSNGVLADSSKPLLEWVRTADKLPPDNETHFLVVGGGYGSITIMRGAYVHYSIKDKGGLKPPTHWMPLPAMPSGGGV